MTVGGRGGASGVVLVLIDGGFLLQQVQTQVAAPAPLGGLRHGGCEAVHVVTTVTVVTEEQLVVVLGGAADVAALALDALPAVRLHGRHHHRGELQARGVSRSAAVGARDQLLGLPRLLVDFGVPQAEVAVIVGQSQPIGALLGWRGEKQWGKKVNLVENGGGNGGKCFWMSSRGDVRALG